MLYFIEELQASFLLVNDTKMSSTSDEGIQFLKPQCSFFKKKMTYN